jgi:hypothetical protein
MRMHSAAPRLAPGEAADSTAQGTGQGRRGSATIAPRCSCGTPGELHRCRANGGIGWRCPCCLKSLSAWIPHPSQESGWPCNRPPREPSRVAPAFPFYACHRHYPGGTPGCSHRSLPQRQRPSPTYRRVGFRIPLFEACSTFTHVIACIFVKPPKVALCTRVLSSRFTPWAAAPITTGWSDICRAGFAPAGRPCLCTAHGMSGGTSAVWSGELT